MIAVEYGSRRLDSPELPSCVLPPLARERLLRDSFSTHASCGVALALEIYGVSPSSASRLRSATMTTAILCHVMLVPLKYPPLASDTRTLVSALLVLCVSGRKARCITD